MLVFFDSLGGPFHEGIIAVDKFGAERLPTGKFPRVWIVFNQGLVIFFCGFKHVSPIDLGN